MMKVDAAAPAMPQEVQTKLRKAAEDFTAVALNELLKPMFDGTAAANGPFGGGAAEEQFRPMMISEIAKQIARSGGLGIEEPVYQQMMRMQAARK